MIQQQFKTVIPFIVNNDADVRLFTERLCFGDKWRTINLRNAIRQIKSYQRILFD